MLTSLAVSIAAFSRMLPLGSPPPALAATVISRRILEKSLPRCTSALPFLRLICDHRECPDIVHHGGLDMAPKPPKYSWFYSFVVVNVALSRLTRSRRCSRR